MSNIEKLKGKLYKRHIFMTGGTGFFGKSFIEFFIRNEFEINLTILTRNPDKFVKSNPELAKDILLIKGNILEPPKKHGVGYDYVIHAAAPVTGAEGKDNALTIFDDIVTGMRNVLEFSNINSVKKLLNISSGAVYGKQTFNLPAFKEDYLGSPDTSNPLSAYGEGKRVAELLCSINSASHKLEYSNARCFSFVGKYLPLDSHFAIGNFIRNGLRNEDIIIKGDGTAIRTYMFTDDLILWLLTVMVYGKNAESYNIGSDVCYSIKDVANHVAKLFPNSRVVIEKKLEGGLSSSRYIPSINKIKDEFELEVEFDLDVSILKTVNYLKNHNMSI